MSAATQEIADLDYSLLNDGQTITLTRGAASVDCYAFVRELIEEQLVDTTGQQRFRITISPTQIDADEWPAPVSSPPVTPDPRIPIKGDKVLVAGRVRTVQMVLPIFVQDVLVRIDFKALG